MVATLVELDRAQKLAQRIGAARPRYGFHDVVGTSPALLRALGIAKQAATVDSTVLITGESGSGKEIVAQAIHTSSARAAEPFIGLNVAALSRELLEEELFGYERGAFPGARSEGSLGKLELAGAGTVLLDEIGECRSTSRPSSCASCRSGSSSASAARPSAPFRRASSRRRTAI